MDCARGGGSCLEWESLLGMVPGVLRGLGGWWLQFTRCSSSGIFAVPMYVFVVTGCDLKGQHWRNSSNVYPAVPLGAQAVDPS